MINSELSPAGRRLLESIVALADGKLAGGRRGTSVEWAIREAMAEPQIKQRLRDLPDSRKVLHSESVRAVCRRGARQLFFNL